MFRCFKEKHKQTKPEKKYFGSSEQCSVKIIPFLAGNMRWRKIKKDIFQIEMKHKKGCTPYWCCGFPKPSRRHSINYTFFPLTIEIIRMSNPFSFFLFIHCILFSVVCKMINEQKIIIKESKLNTIEWIELYRGVVMKVEYLKQINMCIVYTADKVIYQQHSTTY